MNISQAVHPTHYIFGVGGANGAISGSLDGGAVAHKPLRQLGFLVEKSQRVSRTNEQTNQPTKEPTNLLVRSQYLPAKVLGN